jgi:hypoxanthine phosphoribosyltransferase
VTGINKKVLYSKETIEKRVQEIAQTLSDDYQGRDVVFICILKGAYIFLADLLRHLAIPHTIDFMRVASYGSGTVSSGKISVTKDIETDIEGKDVVIVEDIIDTGITLAFLKNKLQEKTPRSLKICALLDKKARREIEIDADYVGFSMDEGFVVGYGLDFDEKFRSLPDIYVIEG